MKKTMFAFCLSLLFLLGISSLARGETYYISQSGKLSPLETVTVTGDTTLYGVAKEHNTTVSRLLAWNDVDPCLLQVGTVLYLPPKEDDTVPAFRERAGLFALDWPAEGEITSLFGARQRNFHYGLDIGADYGTEIHAAAAGRVIEADWKNDAYGWAVMIDHGSGVETLYGHCQTLLAEEGDWVAAGDTVALMGSTGNSTGPHVHFEVRLAGECADPLVYLPGGRTAEK